MNVLQSLIYDIVLDRQPVDWGTLVGYFELDENTVRNEVENLIKMHRIDERDGLLYIYSFDGKYCKVEEVMMVARSMDVSGTLGYVVNTVFLEDVDFFIITENDFLAGVVSKKDIIKKAVIEKVDLSTPVGEIMTSMPNVFYVNRDEKIAIATNMLLQNDLDFLPVVERTLDGLRVAGIFNKSVVARLYLETLEG